MKELLGNRFRKSMIISFDGTERIFYRNHPFTIQVIKAFKNHFGLCLILKQIAHLNCSQILRIHSFKELIAPV